MSLRPMSELLEAEIRGTLKLRLRRMWIDGVLGQDPDHSIQGKYLLEWYRNASPEERQPFNNINMQGVKQAFTRLDNKLVVREPLNGLYQRLRKRQLDHRTRSPSPQAGPSTAERYPLVLTGDMTRQSVIALLQKRENDSTVYPKLPDLAPFKWSALQALYATDQRETIELGLTNRTFHDLCKNFTSLSRNKAIEGNSFQGIHVQLHGVAKVYRLLAAQGQDARLTVRSSSPPRNA